MSVKIKSITSGKHPVIKIPLTWKCDTPNKRLSKESDLAFHYALEDIINMGIGMYEAAKAKGICEEQARLFLPGAVLNRI